MKRVARFGKHSFDLSEDPRVMGILNVTPDSFSDGGLADSLEKALGRVEQMLAEGASIIDVGGESTRPGYEPVTEREEIRRVVPVVEACVERFPEVVLSVDTSKAGVAEAALAAGAAIVNDVWGFQRDPQLAAIAAHYRAGCVAMRNGRDSDRSNGGGPILKRIRRWWEDSARILADAGVAENRIVLDPGIGFGTTREEDLDILSGVSALRESGFPVLIGASRKRVTGSLWKLPVGERLETTLAATAIAVYEGADFVRAHDVRENLRAARMGGLLRKVK